MPKDPIASATLLSSSAAPPGRVGARAFVIAWVIALLFYVLEYAARSSPAVMIPQLSTAFGETALGVSAILGTYYYTYSLASLVAGVALDRAGAKYAVALGCAVLGAGCLLFAVSSPVAGYAGRLLQGAGSAFAFTGAVYLASRGFSPRSLATAIGVTQCLGMLGGSAGQFVVGPLLGGGIAWSGVWIFFGIVGAILAAALFLITPGNQAGAPPAGNLLKPYGIVLSNPQSYLCGLIAGLLFTPTTIGDMTWGVAFFQKDAGLDFRHAVTVISMVPLGWVVGCPLLGWLADRFGLRKPALIGGAVVMLVMVAQIALLPQLLPPLIGMFLFGVASGAAMIPYTIIKEANPDEVKGSATGAQNFLVFGISALLGPVFGDLLGRTLETAPNHLAHFRAAGIFWMATILVAIVASFFLRETGHRQGKP
ncbi:MFS transporter [Aliidongia dinghuensis]|uniref:MFS transporter n=1 Tax=Aliidongia dinghuensis TaxID=1867774 RepID=A0A8J3E794_9PROT|nr:MFS transporter [Aliidongia dinghuensis]GGF49768.1 MFS transporter [Aliidongia dinghuensis]